MNNPITVDYVLFTHLPVTEKAWEVLEKQGSHLVKVLTDAGSPGILEIFIDPGWVQLLNTIGQDFNPIKLSEDFQKIKECEERFDKFLNMNHRLKDRMRLITAKTLYPILNNIRGNKAGNEAMKLKKYLVADTPDVRYDTTKVVEAIIRIRYLGYGIPVLRMDWDALLNDDTLTKHLLLVTRDIPKTCGILAKDHRIGSYIISGSYEMPPKDTLDTWDINDFNTSFATRMFPALIPTENVCKKLNADIVQVKTETQDGQLDETKFLELSQLGLFDKDVMNSYYGLIDSSGGLSSVGGLSLIGSNPLLSVISGAALVLSDGAILDLPPFSNFRWNVMWIDDFLKYELHKALGHFPTEMTLPWAVVGNMTPAIPGRISDAVYKDRVLAGQGNLRKYTLGGYMPTLLLGILMDAWIRNDHSRTPFIEVLENSLRCGNFLPESRERLQEDLKDLAINRINLLIEQWSALKTITGEKSFAALWISGTKAEIQQVLSGLSQPRDDWKGWGLLDTISPSIVSLEEVREPLRKCIEELTEDVCTYIDWTIYWPNFIQSVRADKSVIF